MNKKKCYYIFYMLHIFFLDIDQIIPLLTIQINSLDYTITIIAISFSLQIAFFNDSFLYIIHTTKFSSFTVTPIKFLHLFVLLAFVFSHALYKYLQRLCIPSLKFISQDQWFYYYGVHAMSPFVSHYPLDVFFCHVFIEFVKLNIMNNAFNILFCF